MSRMPPPGGVDEICVGVGGLAELFAVEQEVAQLAHAVAVLELEHRPRQDCRGERRDIPPRELVVHVKRQV